MKPWIPSSPNAGPCGPVGPLWGPTAWRLGPGRHQLIRGPPGRRSLPHGLAIHCISWKMWKNVKIPRKIEIFEGYWEIYWEIFGRILESTECFRVDHRRYLGRHNRSGIQNLLRIMILKIIYLGWWFQPLWKIWVRQLGSLFPIWWESHSKFHCSSHHQPLYLY